MAHCTCEHEAVDGFMRQGRFRRGKAFEREAKGEARNQMGSGSNTFFQI